MSRIFGIFNEEIIRIWCDNNKSPFQNIGRPTIYDQDGKYYTLDFLLKDEKGHLFVTEMKCEIEYKKYKCLTLQGCDQLKRPTKKRAFQLPFFEIAQDREKYEIKCNGELVRVNGSSLVWGRTSLQGINDIKESFLVSHVLSTESIVADLIEWGDHNYLEFIGQHETWSSSLFSGLIGKGLPNKQSQSDA